MERHIQADNAFIKWMETMSKNVVHIADAWQAAVKWADSHPQWIPVEEELPKENEEVLAYNAESEEVIACDYHHKMFHCWPEVFGKSITHWMPLPAAPRKEGVEK